MATGGASSPSAAALATIDPSDMSDLLLGGHPNRASGFAIGKAFLDGQADPPSIDQVVHGLVHMLDLPARDLFELSPLEMQAKLKTRINDDFSLGQTRHVEGWVLSETETWLCALAALKRS